MTGEVDITDVDEYVVSLMAGEERDRPSERSVKAWARMETQYAITVFHRRYDADKLLDAIELAIEHDDLVREAAAELEVTYRDAFSIMLAVNRYVTARKFMTRR